MSVASVAQVLADPPLNNDTVSPGLLGFGVFLALCAALFLLLRSMNKQMKRIRVPHEAELEHEREDSQGPGEPAAGEPGKGVKPAGRDQPGS